MLSLQRQRQYLEYITRRQSAQVSKLGSAFSVSPSTVRRDLKELEESGLVRRVHGGAVLTRESGETQLAQRNESPLFQRAGQQTEQKRRIGQAGSVRLIPLDDVSILVTDSAAPAGALHALRERGVTVIQA